MTKVIIKIDKILQYIYDSIIIITGSIVTLLIIVGAFMRYVLKIDFYGSEEIILIFGYWLYFIGSISAARAKSHLNANMVTVFTRNKKVIAIANVVMDVISLAICILAIKWCADYWNWTFPLRPKTSVHKIPLYLQQLPMCLSFLMWGLYLIRDCYNSIRNVKDINSAAQASAEGGNR
ncbi:MAG: TRAP transporter small permease [Clostridiales bacterium]|nr:TRAP transporter small permease [Clostridiales bacterium]